MESLTSRNWGFLFVGTLLIVSVTALSGSAIGAGYFSTPFDALKTDRTGSTGGGAINGSLQVTVVYESTGLPVSGAFVMVGPRENYPFTGNVGYTNSSGVVQFSNVALVGPISVTAGAANHELFTLVGVNANTLTIPLRISSETSTTYQIGDYVSGVEVNNGFIHAGDGYVDMALVTHALSLEMVMNFDIANLIGPMETMSVLGNEVEVPSNVFIPQQWEIFIEINKNHYYLYLEPATYTMEAISGRIGTQTLLDFINSGGEMADIIPLLNWRKIDILNHTVTGDNLGVDLTVSPNLSSTVTMNLSNVPANSTAYGLSIGDLDNLHGTGRLIVLGLSALSCDIGPCNGALSLSTTAASGEFSGMGYIAAAMVLNNTTTQTLAIMDRATHNQTYTTTMSSFFSQLGLTYSSAQFGWNDVINSGTSSPDVHFQMALLSDTTTEAKLWRFYIHGDLLSFTPPILPASAPGGPANGQACTWDHSAMALTYNMPSFNFNNFAFTSILGSVTHLSFASANVTYQAPLPPATATPTYTGTAQPTRTPTRTPTGSPTRSPTLTPSSTATLVPTNTQVPTNTATRTPTRTPTTVPTNTPVPTYTATLVPTNTPTQVPTNTATLTPTRTPTLVPTNTDTPTAIPTETPILATYTPVCIKNGDVNNDGLYSAGDAQLAFYIALGTYSPTYEELCAADCNGDGSISAGDAQLIFGAALGMGGCVDPL